jgi:hypothetical protein
MLVSFVMKGTVFKNCSLFYFINFYFRQVQLLQGAELKPSIASHENQTSL